MTEPSAPTSDNAPVDVQPGLDDRFVEVSDLVVRRRGSVALAVDHLELGCGTTALVGPNGSGKSTLLHVIAGLIEPDSGSVRVLGETPTAAQPQVAYVLQSQVMVPHMPITAREVVSLGRAPSVGLFGRLGARDRAVVTEAMERLEVADLADRQLAEMSGGQRQRVLIAQGIAQESNILLLDEPVAGVDIASIATIRTVIAEERAAGRAVIVATHDLAEANGYDCVVLLAGRVVASGATGDVLSGPNLREAYAGRLLDIGGSELVVDDGSHHDHDHDHGHRDHGHHDHGHHDHGHSEERPRP